MWFWDDFSLDSFLKGALVCSSCSSRKEGEALAAKHLVGSSPSLGPTTLTTRIATLR